ncbi:MAG: lipocalin family protein [bacterium]
MIARRSGLALLVLLGTWTGCGKDDTTGPSPQGVVGTWQATKIEYVQQSPPASVDLIALGATAQLVLDSDHTFVYTLTASGQSPDVNSGTWQLSGQVMTVSPEGMPFSWQFEITLAANKLTLTGADGEFDFNGDDVMEPAKMNLEFSR